MPNRAALIASHVLRLLRQGVEPAEAQRRAEAFYAADAPELNKVLPGGAGGPL